MINKFLSKFDLLLADPNYLWLLLLLPIIFWIKYKWIDKRSVTLTVSTTHKLRDIPKSWKVTYRPILNILSALAFIFIVFALARPQKTNVYEDINNEGIDIMLSLDISTSMLAEDFNPNRVEAAKRVAAKFIQDRPNDRIGLVIFSGESFTQCPITIDHNVVLEQLAAIESGLLQDGTSIGMGLATAANRLKNATGKSKVIILMTDGVNTGGLIDPETALEIAKMYGIRVYTIGIGTKGEALYPVETPAGIVKQKMPVQIDEALLSHISQTTGGKYFRATDNNSLSNVYKEIDKLEKTKVNVSAYRQYKDQFFVFGLLGLLCLLMSTILKYTIFKTIP